MSSQKRTILITGCSSGSLGAALAHEFHQQGLTVFATARDADKMEDLRTAGIHCLTLDVLSDESIKQCVEEVSQQTSGTLDILVNNAGGGYYMPFLHLDLQKARNLFETNVWSYLSVTQAFLPLLLRNTTATSSSTSSSSSFRSSSLDTENGNPKKKRKSLLVNNTSISSVLRTPYHSAYNASKAAIAAFTATQRIELQPLGILVVDLKTGSTKSHFQHNKLNEHDIPPDSPYMPIKDEVLNVIRGDATEAYAEDQSEWATNVVRDLLRDDPPFEIWRGGKAGTINVTSKTEWMVPSATGDREFQKLGGLDKLDRILNDS